MNLEVRRGRILHRRATTADELSGELEAQVHPPRPQVDEQVPRGGGRGVRRSGQCSAGVKFSGTWTGEQPVPQVRAARRRTPIS
jgi:hypothetical protein